MNTALVSTMLIAVLVVHTGSMSAMSNSANVSGPFGQTSASSFSVCGDAGQRSRINGRADWDIDSPSQLGPQAPDPLGHKDNGHGDCRQPQ